jgi:hypothetical protein
VTLDYRRREGTMAAKTAEERQLIARAAGLASAARPREVVEQQLADARQRRWQKLLDKVDPRGELDDDERDRRAHLALRQQCVEARREGVRRQRARAEQRRTEEREALLDSLDN